MALDSLAQTQRRAIATEAAAARIFGGLLDTVLPDQNEVWDVWCKLGKLVGPPEERHLEAVRNSSRPSDPAEEAELGRYAAADSRFANGLLGILEAGELSVGVRGLMVFVVQFCLNRHGLDRAAQAALAAAMIRDLHPHRAL
jgi:hypothetical protein